MTAWLGAVLFNDVAIAHESYYRPPVKFAAALTASWASVPNACRFARLGGLAGLAGLQIELHINGVHRQTTALAELLRDAATLLADVSEFMTLRPRRRADAWAPTAWPTAHEPLVHPGDTVEITATGVQPPPCTASSTGGGRMKRARIAWAGAVHDAIEADGQLELLTPASQGPPRGLRRRGLAAATSSPTAAARVRAPCIALGLNYADHAKELAFKAPEEPLAFCEGRGLSLTGHQRLHACARPAWISCITNVSSRW